jgi:hypothetical protein
MGALRSSGPVKQAPIVMAQTFETFAHWVIRPPCIHSLRFPDSPWLRVSVVNFHLHFLGSTSSRTWQISGMDERRRFARNTKEWPKIPLSPKEKPPFKREKAVSHKKAQKAQ